MLSGNARSVTRSFEINFPLIIDGSTDFKSHLQEPIELNPTRDAFWIRQFGKSRITLLQFVEKIADVSGDSFERLLMTILLRRGFQLEELEVEFTDTQCAKWGSCVWYKEHPSYAEPLDAKYPPGAQAWASFINARWKTAHAGEKKTGLLSAKLLPGNLTDLPYNILLRHAVIYRKAAFTSPKAKE